METNLGMIRTLKSFIQRRQEREVQRFLTSNYNTTARIIDIYLIYKKMVLIKSRFLLRMFSEFDC